MASKSKTEVKLRSASESQVAGMICRMFGVTPTESLQRTFDYIADVHGQRFPELRQDFNLYPWECPVPQFVMSDKVNQLVEDIAGSDGLPFIVRDSSASGKLSLWVVRATFSDPPGDFTESSPVRALMNHFLIGDEWLKVTAFQLETCLRKLKTNPEL